MINSPDLLTPNEYLKYLQRNWAARVGIRLNDDGTMPVPDELNQFVLKNMEQEIRMIAEAVGVSDPRSYLPTSFPLGSDGGLLRPLVETAFGLLEPQEQAALQEVPIGIVHQPLLNAARLRVPAGGYIIVLNYALFCGLNIGFRELLWLLNDFFRPHFFIHFETFVDEHATSMAALARVMRREFLYDGSITHNFRHMDPLQGLWAGSLSSCAQLFILLHEFAHVVCEHPQLGRPHPADQPNLYAKFCLQSCELEDEADRWAASKIKKLPPKFPEPISVQQMEVALPMLFYLFHMCQALFPGEFADESTHPPFLVRLDTVMREAFHVSSDELPQVKDLGKLYEMFDQLKDDIRSRLKGN
jgi:hypothetical protein